MKLRGVNSIRHMDSEIKPISVFGPSVLGEQHEQSPTKHGLISPLRIQFQVTIQTCMHIYTRTCDNVTHYKFII